MDSKHNKQVLYTALHDALLNHVEEVNSLSKQDLVDVIGQFSGKMFRALGASYSEVECENFTATFNLTEEISDEQN